MAETEIPKVTKFKHFTSLQNICKVLNAAVMKKDSKFIGGYFWVNSDINISQIQPRFYQIFVTRIKPGSDVKVRPDKWTKDMMNWPFMEIDISHNCEAHGCNGFPGMIGTDGIKIKFFKGMDLSKYDESIEEWKKNGAGEYIKADIPGRWDTIKTFEPKDCYEFEEKLIKYFNDGSILDPIKQLWCAWDYFENVNNVFEEKKPVEVVDDEEYLEET